MLHKLRTLLILLVVIVAGFYLGGMARNLINLGTLPPPLAPKLADKATFPDVPVLDRNGVTRTTGELLGNRGGVVMFLALGCNPCKDMSSQWQGLLNQGKLDGIILFGITESSPEKVAGYRQAYGLTFPIYSDTSMVFSRYYNVKDYPLRLIVDRQGVIRAHTCDPGEPVDLEEVRRQIAG